MLPSGFFFPVFSFFPPCVILGSNITRKRGDTMNIGRIHVDSRLVLAPMAGVTDLAFRQI